MDGRAIIVALLFIELIERLLSVLSSSWKSIPFKDG